MWPFRTVSLTDLAFSMSFLAIRSVIAQIHGQSAEIGPCNVSCAISDAFSACLVSFVDRSGFLDEFSSRFVRSLLKFVA